MRSFGKRPLQNQSRRTWDARGCSVVGRRSVPVRVGRPIVVEPFVRTGLALRGGARHELVCIVLRCVAVDAVDAYVARIVIVINRPRGRSTSRPHGSFRRLES